jgi:hypothetical protein
MLILPVFANSVKTAARSASTASRGFATSASARAGYEDTIKNILISVYLVPLAALDGQEDG